ncbi:hypothetical protein ACE1OC_42755 (plasmid) [Streptomyces sp. DSM 116496]|uniref:hypothetical protein n=1 Tax=Streptomyces stoeckheimensis TaxID=3344656 RepID=UPI0038B3D6CA
MTPAGRRLSRVRASAGIVKLAIQQIQDELDGPADAEFLAETLRELFDEPFPQDGILGSLNQLLTVASRAAARAAALTPPDGEDAARALEEAAAFLTDSAGMRLHRATATLHPQGESV